MFGFGSAGGLLTDVREALDTSKWEAKTAEAKADISKKLTQVNSATVGAYNNAVQERALERKAYEEDKPEEIGGLNNARKQELLDRIKEEKRKEFEARAMEFDENGNPTETNNADMVAEYQAEMEKIQNQYDNGEISDEELIEKAGGKDASWYITDAANAIGDGISTGLDYVKSGLKAVGDVVSDAYDAIKGEMCNNSPYTQCVGCSNRPKLARKKYNPLSGLGNITSLLKSGLTDALEGLLDCPGMATAITEGDFSKVGGAIGTAAFTKGIKVAASIGSAAVYSGLSKLAGSAMMTDAGASLGKLVGNIPGSESALSTTSNLMQKYGITADKMFSATMSVAGRTLAGTEIAGAGFIGGVLAQDKDLAVETTLLDLRRSPTLDKVIRTNKTRTRYGLTACDLGGLFGSTTSTREYRSSFAIDAIKNNYRTPRDTKVRRHRSSADTLM